MYREQAENIDGRMHWVNHHHLFIQHLICASILIPRKFIFFYYKRVVVSDDEVVFVIAIHKTPFIFKMRIIKLQYFILYSRIYALFNK